MLLLHPHLAHSSTTNVRSGCDVRLALTKRAYWISAPSPALSCVELPPWAVRQGCQPPVAAARDALLPDQRLLPWPLLRQQVFEVPLATVPDVLARLQGAQADVDLGGLVLGSDSLQQALEALAGRTGLVLGLGRCGLGPATGWSCESLAGRL